MSPTANGLYSSGRFDSKSRRWKSDSYKLFLSYCSTFQLYNQIKIKECELYLKEKTKDGFVIQLDTYFIFPRDKIWTKSKKSKSAIHQMDTSNRIKALHDVFAKMINIDDRYFFSGFYDKVEGSKESVTLIIKPIKPTTEESLAL